MGSHVEAATATTEVALLFPEHSTQLSPCMQGNICGTNPDVVKSGQCKILLFKLNQKRLCVKLNYNRLQKVGIWM